MSIKNQNTPLENYKLSHETIQRINAKRLKVHTQKIYQLDRSYYCGCCGMASYDIYDSHSKEHYEAEKAKHEAIKRYLHYVVGQLKAKPDYEQALNDLSESRERKIKRAKNKGVQNKSKSLRKKERAEEKRNKKWNQKYDRIKLIGERKQAMQK